MTLFAKLRAALVATSVFLLLFAACYFVHARYLLVDVVLYAALVDLAVAAALAGLLIHRARWLGVLGSFERLLLVSTWLLAGMLIAFAVPTLIDRSFSFYILEKLQQRGGGIAADRIGDVILDEFAREHRLMDVRLTEQLVSGTIIIENNCVRLTERGQRIASFGRLFRTHVLPRRRLLMGTYTDELTDPFRESSDVAFNYACGDADLPRGTEQSANLPGDEPDGKQP